MRLLTRAENHSSYLISGYVHPCAFVLFYFLGTSHLLPRVCGFINTFFCEERKRKLFNGYCRWPWPGHAEATEIYPGEERKEAEIQKLLAASLLYFSTSAGILSFSIKVKPVFLYNLQQCPLPWSGQCCTFLLLLLFRPARTGLAWKMDSSSLRQDFLACLCSCGKAAGILSFSAAPVVCTLRLSSWKYSSHTSW